MSVERMLLLRESDQALRESQNDVIIASLLRDGWVEVTGVAEYEERCTKELHPTLKA